ncbi:MAG TPA: S1-like domain-containing RNA-binding protein [Flavobacteriales bacterium]|nr:S1-like domain-containing RNA-binding protein [Flavobacteriales bacterium]
MIRTGRTQDLIILRHTSEGLILGDDDDAEAFLPKSGSPAHDADGSTVRVFVYRDKDGRLMATTRPVKAQVGEFVQLRVRAIRGAGANMDWGLDTDLLIPHEEQKKDMEEGRWYVVRVALDTRTDQIYGSTRIENFLDNTSLTVEKGEAVALMVFSRSDLGLSVIVNDVHQGLVHANEIFKPVSIGDRITGYVKHIREDNKLDITLQPIGYRQYNDANTALLAKRLRSQGLLHLTDKSSAEEIHAEFGISKKAFKKALGALYKERKVRIGEDGIVWIG